MSIRVTDDINAYHRARYQATKEKERERMRRNYQKKVRASGREPRTYNRPNLTLDIPMAPPTAQDIQRQLESVRAREKELQDKLNSLINKDKPIQ